MSVIETHTQTSAAKCVFSPPYDILGNTKPAVTMETLTALLTVKAETEGVCVCLFRVGGFLCVCMCGVGWYIDFMTNSFLLPEPLTQGHKKN